MTKALEKEFSISITDRNVADTDLQDFKTHGHGVIRQVMFNFLGLSSREK